MRAKGKRNGLRWALGILACIALTGMAAPAVVQAQVPPLVEAELVKMGRVVDPGCTGKLYRTLFDKNDYNTYWPVDAAMPNTKVKLYPGVTVTRDVSYGPQPKDLIDIFVSEKGGANRTVFIFIPGGAGNKIEQQAVESNMFYDNIGTWAANNGMIGVTMQRGGTAAGQNVALVIEWLQANVAKYKGNPADMFLMAHSAGTGPLTQYIGRPDLYGQGVKGAIFMGAHPGIGIGGGARGGAVVERALADEVAEPQRLRVRPRVWRMPMFRLVRFEDRAVHWPTREPERQQRAWHWQELPPGAGMVSSGFPLELRLRRQQLAVAEPGGGRRRSRRSRWRGWWRSRWSGRWSAGGQAAEQPEPLPQRQPSPCWTDSNRPEPRSHWHGANWISMPLPEPACRHNRSPYTTNFASWKVQRQRTASVIAPR